MAKSLIVDDRSVAQTLVFAEEAIEPGKERVAAVGLSQQNLVSAHKRYQQDGSQRDTITHLYICDLN